MVSSEAAEGCQWAPCPASRALVGAAATARFVLLGGLLIEPEHTASLGAGPDEAE